jgi:hypothetical protein
MLRKFITYFLVCTVALLTVPTSNNFAQTQLNTEGDQYLRDAQFKRTTDLKGSFATEVARIKAGTLTKADFERIQKASQNPKAQSSFSKREKIFLAVWIVVMTALVVVVIKHPCKAKDPKDCEPIDDSSQF